MNHNALKLLQQLQQLSLPVSADAFTAGSSNHHGVIRQEVASKTIEQLDWTHNKIEHCRFTAGQFENCCFDQVLFNHCDFSGVSFVNCLIRDCFIVNSKASSHLSFDGCIFDNAHIMQCKFEQLEIQHSKIGNIDLSQLNIQKLRFHQCQKYKLKGRISLRHSQLEAVGGFEQLANNAISVIVDESLLHDLGNFYLQQKGIQRQDETTNKLQHQLASCLDSLS